MAKNKISTTTNNKKSFSDILHFIEIVIIASFVGGALFLWQNPQKIVSWLNIKQNTKDNTAIEKLVKVGMFKMVVDMIGSSYNPKLLKEDETKLYKLLQIDKARLKRLKEMNGGIVHLKWIQLEKRAFQMEGSDARMNTIHTKEMRSQKNCLT